MSTAKRHDRFLPRNTPLTGGSMRNYGFSIVSHLLSFLHAGSSLCRTAALPSSRRRAMLVGGARATTDALIVMIPSCCSYNLV